MTDNSSDGGNITYTQSSEVNVANVDTVDEVNADAASAADGSSDGQPETATEPPVPSPNPADGSTDSAPGSGNFQCASGDPYTLAIQPDWTAGTVFATVEAALVALTNVSIVPPIPLADYHQDSLTSTDAVYGAYVNGNRIAGVVIVNDGSGWVADSYEGCSQLSGLLFPTGPLPHLP
jgi:hypothetical protein